MQYFRDARAQNSEVVESEEKVAVVPDRTVLSKEKKNAKEGGGGGGERPSKRAKVSTVTNTAFQRAVDLFDSVVNPRGGSHPSGQNQHRSVHRSGGIASRAADVVTALIEAINVGRGLVAPAVLTLPLCGTTMTALNFWPSVNKLPPRSSWPRMRSCLRASEARP